MSELVGDASCWFKQLNSLWSMRLFGGFAQPVHAKSARAQPPFDQESVPGDRAFNDRLPFLHSHKRSILAS
jgi:hypothetical protein